MHNFLNETIDRLNDKYFKLLPVTKGASGKSRETLAEFVKRIREEKGLSLKDLERKSNGAISSGYVSQIENGRALNPSPKKLKVLASVLSISEEDLLAISLGASAPKKLTESKLYKLFEEYEQIENPGHRQAADVLIDGVERLIAALPKKRKADDPDRIETVRKSK